MESHSAVLRVARSGQHGVLTVRPGRGRCRAVPPVQPRASRSFSRTAPAAVSGPVPQTGRWTASPRPWFGGRASARHHVARRGLRAFRRPHGSVGDGPLCSRWVVFVRSGRWSPSGACPASSVAVMRFPFVNTVCVIDASYFGPTWCYWCISPWSCGSRRFCAAGRSFLAFC